MKPVLALNALRVESAEPGPLPADALDFFRKKGIKPSFHFEDVWAEEHLAAFTAAAAMQEDVLAALREGVDLALAEGHTFEMFDARLRDRLAALGWWGEVQVVDPATGEVRTVNIGARRLQVIFETNMRTARAAGQWERIQRTKKFRPYLQYGLGPSRVHRDQHVAWNGMILPADHPFWRDGGFPPNGWGCRCVVRQLSRAEAERLGGETRDFSYAMTASRNTRTGRVKQHIEGVDPSFSYPPGRRMAGLGSPPPDLTPDR